MIIIPEDKAHQIIIDILGFGYHDRADGISKVVNKLLEKPENEIGIGIIDDDKRKPPKIVTEFSHFKQEDELELWKHKTRKLFLIVVKPASEKWLLSSSQDAKIDLTLSNINSDFNSFRKLMKRGDIYNNQDLRAFLAQIKHNAPLSFTVFEKWLNEIAAL